jgi:hypothetical protein
MDVFLELQTAQPEELRDALTAEAAAGETDIEVADELSMCFEAIESQRDSTAFVIFALTFPMGIATNVIADRISEFLKSRRDPRQVERAFIVVEEEVEEFDEDGNGTARITTRRTEISTD